MMWSRMTRTWISTRWAAIMCLALAPMMLGGCGSSYTLRAKVVQGSSSAVALVNADDPQLSQPGIANAWVAVYRDPDSLQPSLAAGRLSAADGTVVCPLKGWGAGWMQETWQVEAKLAGYQTATSMIALPKDSKKTWILVTLARGSTAEESTDYREQFEQFK